MKDVWCAVLLMNSDLLDVMLSQLCTFTNVPMEPAVPGSTGRGVSVLPEVAGSKHVQNGAMFLTDNTANSVLFEFQTQFVVTPT
jgi:hypothetical protein